MEREQASNLIREIFTLCHYIDGKSIRLVPPEENNPLSIGFMIQIEKVNHELV
jgi:hypothetical protein